MNEYRIEDKEKIFTEICSDIDCCEDDELKRHYMKCFDKYGVDIRHFKQSIMDMDPYKLADMYCDMNHNRVEL